MENRKYIEENHPVLARWGLVGVKLLRSLKKPIFYLQVVFFPIRILLGINFYLFWLAYVVSGMIKTSYRAKSGVSNEAKIKQIVDDLKKYGIAKWEGMLTADQVKHVNDLMDKLMPRSREYQKMYRNTRDTIVDPDFPDWSHTWEYVEKEFEPYEKDDISRIYGRARSRSYTPPASMQTFLYNPTITQIASAYYGTQAKPKRVLLEELTPSLMGDGWHVDGGGKMFKSMFLLSDCSAENGPMRYKKGSQKDISPSKIRIFFNMLRYGYLFSSLGLMEARKVVGEVVWATGKAGDCLFFDPTGVHSGSRCLTGRRRSAVISYLAPTFQINFFRCLGLTTT
jgi:hypothetical protein